MNRKFFLFIKGYFNLYFKTKCAVDAKSENKWYYFYIKILLSKKLKILSWKIQVPPPRQNKRRQF